MTELKQKYFDDLYSREVNDGAVDRQEDPERQNYGVVNTLLNFPQRKRQHTTDVNR